MFKLAIRTVLHRRGRLVLTMLAIVLGVGFMTATLSLGESVRRGASEIFEPLAAASDLLVRSEPAFDQTGTAAAREPMDETMLSSVGSIEGVDSAIGAVSGEGVVGSTGADRWSSGALVASADGLGCVSPFRLTAGREPVGPSEVLVDAGTARDEGLVIGAQVRLQASRSATAVVVGLVALGDMEQIPGQAVVLLGLPAAQDLLGRPGQLDEILIDASDDVDVQALAARVDAALPDRLEVVTSDAVADERADDARGAADIVTLLLGAFAVVALFVGGFVILNTFTVIIAQRTRETGLLRAIGAGAGQVVRAVLLEATVVGLTASLLGAVVGLGMATGLRWLADVLDVGLPDGGFVVTGRTIAVPVALGLGLTLVASYVPARRAGRLSPMAALRDVDRRASVARGRVVLGVVLALIAPNLGVIGIPVAMVAATLLAPALVPAAVRLARPALRRFGGVAGRLGAENALRNPLRTGATASALMVGLSLVVGMTILADSALTSFTSALEGSVRSDLIVSSRKVEGFAPALADELEELPEVGLVARQRYGQFDLVGIDEVATPQDARTQDLSGIQPATYGEAFDIGVIEGSVADLTDGGVIVHEDIAARQGWRVGDTIRMRFAKAGVQEVEVDGIYTENSLESQGYMLSLVDYERFYSDQLDVRVFVSAAPGITVDALRTAVERAARDYPGVEVDTADSFIAEVTSVVDVVLAAVNVLLGLAVVIAVLGIVNTLALSMHERTRELGLVRAIGMTQEQVRAMVRWESLIMSLLGSGLALLVGVVVGRALLDEIAGTLGGQVTYPVGRLALFVALGALVGLAAAVLPARRAARIAVLDAIRTA